MLELLVAVLILVVLLQTRGGRRFVELSIGSVVVLVSSVGIYDALEKRDFVEGGVAFLILLVALVVLCRPRHPSNEPAVKPKPE